MHGPEARVVSPMGTRKTEAERISGASAVFSLE